MFLSQRKKKNFKHIWIISHHNDLRRMVPQMRGKKIVRNKKALKMELELTTFKLSKLISTILKIQQLPSLHLLFKLDIFVFCVTPKCSLKGFLFFFYFESQWLGRWGCCSADPFPLDLAWSDQIWGLGPGVEVSDPWQWRSWVLSAPSCSCWGPARTLCSEMKGPAVKPRSAGGALRVTPQPRQASRRMEVPAPGSWMRRPWPHSGSPGLLVRRRVGSLRGGGW